MIAPMPEKTKISHALLTLFLSGFLTLLALEIGLRFLPVSDSFLSQPVTFEQPVARFTPNRDVTWSREFNFEMVNQRHINNDGFFNDQDYDPEDQRPLVAVIGDSYIEAVMVPHEETVYGRLEKTLAPDRRVYSFGASGAPLSQYLIWAQYARQTYNAQKMVFTIVGNDFDESLPKYQLHQTFQQFVADENGTLKPKLIQEYHPGKSRILMRHSALARYLLMNMKLYPTLNKLKSRLLQRKLDQKTRYVGNVPAKVSEERLNDSYKAVDAFFDNLPDYTGLQKRDITFVVDAPRFLIYNAEAAATAGQSYFEKMRSYFLKVAWQRGYEAIDLHPVFSENYKKHQKKFEYPTDGHWSGYGHRVVHDALTQTKWFKGVYSSLNTPSPTMTGGRGL